ncbi:GH1 family beta-glucosidase [Flavobacterium johnsoniae]|uniref:Beta-glucosidase n=1 Tax=Flavobacterium johnsoniae (strain ATCC 17061 / DSM 2064 / JCM 8514 / BCRC 14874 / CCUG 350202 / NBRC 14942 / NCIMB 11054 / UW101) TaxID=376686 RepID=A5FAA5_FLAJ1|nr:GH1 family beta-glucosidase [Flavobacterium johnsoniae]ABQ07856.1 Candidate Beta-glucosidase; Glycoside hydrolase family 1 [Flavobacterium johnsoniae UW101]OXG01937.1 beta-glucosidase [Flavobacterium johnsoniae UW101]WQG80300.1 GH1 family beta-glucosidase [Flavobacterium johnsoniae UW101]SHK99724.1 beta-glucosidase [Flavobacterium johnsoniae]
MNKIENSFLNKNQFGEDFLWGVSTAAFQIEGAHDSDGKGSSIWDVFTSQKGKIKNGHHALTACDFYNSYQNDIDLIRELNIPNFRFSISWPRIMPTGVHPVNQAGIDYYNKIIDSLLASGIEPWITLYHWDLPHALEVKGGWTNRESVNWFSEYVEVCAQYFGDRVKNWMVINEPSVFTGAGYFLGIHAPGKKGITNYLKAMHHVTLATAAGARILRNKVPEANIGTTFSCTHIEAATESAKDVEAAKRVDTLLNRTFIEPILGLGYPQKDLPVLKKLNNYILEDDLNNLDFDFDFIGLQCYTREVVKSSILTPYIGAELVSAEKRNVISTEMGWEVYPPALYHVLEKFNKYDKIKKIIITENGAAFPDTVTNGKVFDIKRTHYIQDHLEQILKAKKNGLNVEGYFVWSLTDNFEWAEGYNARFGLIHVDFETQKRTIKNSGLWFKDFLS